jgi:hypothetical protein
MRIRTGLVILGLLVFVICTANLGQAAKSYKYNINDLAPPNEHPWQDHGCPPDADTLVPDQTCPTSIVIGPFKIVIIKLPGVRFAPARINGTADFSHCGDPR